MAPNFFFADIHGLPTRYPVDVGTSGATTQAGERSFTNPDSHFVDVDEPSVDDGWDKDYNSASSLHLTVPMKKIILMFGCVLSLAFFSRCGKDEGPDPSSITPPEFEPINFGSATFGSVNDIDGNSYKTVTIGTATWMAENLRTTKFRNGDAITKVAGNQWALTKNPEFYAYADNADLISLYGHLYNGYVKDDIRGACPAGWHLPTSAEWDAIAVALGGATSAGNKMKEQGTAHWISSNSSDNQSGFTGMPGGSMYQGRLTDLRADGYFWSATPGDFYYLTNTYPNLRTKNTALLSEGLAIRCVKD
jgi:uncharacterized protein (TIGR02145 family)